jgi:hypothetical protein
MAGYLTLVVVVVVVVAFAGCAFAMPMHASCKIQW